ncbi:MAG: ABC transporter permease [Thermoprotei archaeon]
MNTSETKQWDNPYSVGRTLKKILVSTKGFVGIAVVVLFSVLPSLRPFFVKFPPLSDGVGPPNAAPSAAHLLGTTSLGQDVFSQFLSGGLVSVIVGVSTGFIATLLAIGIGIPAGYYRGVGEKLLTLFIDVFLVIPALPLIILFAVYLGPSILNQILILSLLSWPIPARVIRAQVLTLRERAFVQSDVIAGGSSFTIMFREIMPNVMPLILSNGVLVIVFAVLLQAAIAFLGLGAPNVMSWGSMLYYAELSGAISSGEWWWVLPPGVGLMLLAFAFSLILLQIDQVFSQRRGSVS